MPDFLHGVETIELTDGIRPIRTVKSSVIGVIGTAPLADADVFPLNTPVLLTNQPRKAALLGADGTLKAALDGIYDQAGAAVIVVRVDEGADEDATLSNVVGVSADATGVHAFANAEAVVFATPRILIAPGWSHQRPLGNANPVVAELKGIASAMRSIIIADGPGTDDADAISAATEAGSDRIYLVDPGAKVFVDGAPVDDFASARAAGALAGSDNERGFWFSPSNQQLNGVIGTTRPIGFSLSDPNSQANYLNENNVATIIARNGFRLWGNRTTGADPQWAFLSVRRTADMIYESIEANHLWAMDKPISGQLLNDIVDGVNAYLRHLKALGAILGGKAWMDEELNTEASLAAGQLYIDFDIEPPAPLERLTFRAHREAGYYTELAAAIGA
jgi:phage tail sheath protein FI